ncbi:MAG: hypothetical protein WCY27_01350 [archaeon]|jgi:hypothetical protein|nr:hypothetical protein [archaeon]MDD2477970.1 hypothetical protein [Candidatus ainarchaeum sp.]MDD3084964.1 hypothetical protein [Candidatus ainarchaeum sp.]MDD4221400.1 hypothetical protein [Candidatus ainarchaeum sp.]MDD4662960.1 hypothetical protein [Candidatus ainarchaeum sp.]
MVKKNLGYLFLAIILFLIFISVLNPVDSKETNNFNKNIKIDYIKIDYKRIDFNNYYHNLFSSYLASCYCGDGTCDYRAGENPYNCPEDCFVRK